VLASLVVCTGQFGHYFPKHSRVVSRERARLLQQRDCASGFPGAQEAAGLSEVSQRKVAHCFACCLVILSI
jgi:hypothetical protein